MRPATLTRLVLLALCCTPFIAMAHPGHEPLKTFAGGMLHPLTGLDHLLAMLAIGVWARQLGGRSLWIVPTAFVVCLAIGAILGAQPFAIGPAELMIGLSVLTLGVLIARAQRLPLALCVGISGTFALFHGYAHGSEMPVSGSSLTFAAGFMTMTIALHLAGVGIGSMAKSSATHRWIGTALALAGGALLVAAT